MGASVLRYASERPTQGCSSGRDVPLPAVGIRGLAAAAFVALVAGATLDGLGLRVPWLSAVGVLGVGPVFLLLLWGFIVRLSARYPRVEVVDRDRGVNSR